MSRPQVAKLVWDIVEPLSSQRGLEVVDVEYRPEHGRMVLRVFLDRDGGVTLDELARVSRELGDLLEVRDVIRARYTLEVSSPGVNRPLTRPEHFAGFIGKRVRVRTTTAIDGRRNFAGTLVAATETDMGVQLDDAAEVRIPFAAVERANYEHEFVAAGSAGPSHGRPAQRPAGGLRRT